MTINIDDNRRIFDLQEEFTKQFPFLRIEFLFGPKLRTKTAFQVIHPDLSRTIGECRSVHNKGQISIDPVMTVTELEKNFREIYGLNIRLFRKSVNVWLNTSVTDGWSLLEQNQQGETLSKLIA